MRNGALQGGQECRRQESTGHQPLQGRGLHRTVARLKVDSHRRQIKYRRQGGKWTVCQGN